MPPEARSRPSATRAAARRKRTRCTGPGCRRLAPPGRKRCDEHKPGKTGPGRGKLFGRTEPRRFTRPLRPLTRATSRGYEVIDFAEMIGEPLLPWQKWAVIHALELLPDGSYRFRTILILVARQNGKSQLKRIVTLWRMYMDSARRIIGVAQDVALARDQWNMCQATIHACPDLEAEWGRVRNVNGDEWFEASNCRYAIKAANSKAGRGGSNDEVNIDELREQRDWKAWAAVSKTTMARGNGQVWAMSNAGDDNSVVLNQLHAVGLAGTDPSMCLMEWSGLEDCELDDWEQLAQANPGLGYTVSAAAIRSSLGTDPPGVLRTEVLCQKVDQLEGAIDFPAWQACTDPAGNMDGLRNRLAACFDMAPDGQHATLAVAGRLDDGRARIEIAAAWTSTETARAELPALLAKIRPRVITWYPTGPAGAFATMLRPAGKPTPLEKSAPGRPHYAELTGNHVTEVCQELADLVAARQVVQPGDPLLDTHIRGAGKLHSGDGWRFTRAGEGHVDAAYAAAGAVSAALTLPAEKRAQIRVVG